MKKHITIIAFILAGLTSMAQNDTTYWTVENNASLNFTQSYFSNWAAGGENTVAVTGKYTFTANYLKDKHKVTNWLDAALGYSIIGENDPMKTDDKLEFISSYGYEIEKNLYASALLTFKSQFAKGYDYKVDSSTSISNFLAPATFDIGPGIEWKPTKEFLVNVSPVTGKWIVVNDQRLANQGAFGLDPAEVDSSGAIIKNAKKIKSMFGAKVLIAFKRDIFENVNFNTKLELFSDYLDNPQNIDVNWQITLTLKVNSWMNVNINTELVYDDNIMFYNDAGKPIGPRTQFNENMQIGLAVKF